MPAADRFPFPGRSVLLPAALLAAVIAAGCTRRTPGYCDSHNPCVVGVCDTMRNLCGPSDGGTDGVSDASDASDGSDGKADRSDGPTDVPSDGLTDVPTDVPTDVTPPCTAASCGGGTPICDSASKACRGCQSGSECAPRDAGAPVCAAEAGVCVECVASGDCTAKAKPVCNTATNTCRGCASGNECAGLNAATPACVLTGASTGVCVECVMSADCTMAKAKPVCNTATNTCRPCQADAECPAAPGVCMAHVDGHCATSGEVIYVQNSAGTCSDAGGANAGTAAQPLCSMSSVATLVSANPTRNLVVVRGTVTAGTWVFSDQVAPSLSIVGQQSAFLAATTSPAFSMQGGSVYLRGVKLTALASMGISAKGGTLTLDTVTVDSCTAGGILVDGAAFDIRNTTITKNGPSGDLSWGGMRVASLPAIGQPKNLHLVTIENNNAPGLSCAVGATIQGDGVLASGNSTGDVTSSCGITACTAMSSTCGAP